MAQPKTIILLEPEEEEEAHSVFATIPQAVLPPEPVTSSEEVNSSAMVQKTVVTKKAMMTPEAVTIQEAVMVQEAVTVQETPPPSPETPPPSPETPPPSPEALTPELQTLTCTPEAPNYSHQVGTLHARADSINFADVCIEMLSDQEDAEVPVPSTQEQCCLNLQILQDEFNECVNNICSHHTQRGIVNFLVTYTQGINLSAAVCRLSGMMMGVALLVLADCWLAHPPYITSVVTTMLSFCAAVVLNTVEWDILMHAPSHQQVIVLVLTSYGVLFVQCGYVIWQLVEVTDHASTWQEMSTCNRSCCTEVEAYYVILMTAACSILRFGEPMFRGTGTEQYAQVATNSFSHGISICATVGVGGFAVAGIMLQIFATFGKFGNRFGLFTPVPYLIALPMLLVVRGAARIVRTTVWVNWNYCLPLLVYLISVSWPLLLSHRGYLNSAQTVMGFCGNICIVISSRLLMTVLDGNLTSTRAQNSLNFVF